ncbi:PEP-CTERM sorting domain-containing protein [Hydrogenophaga sp.]|uniref:PEP-CTERM sorting domain-containing protein n=1 Tax=Hydrogenophaga sp. TaxID=1904254 RepID=UPI002731D39D|nr:PEP-CTERM sorting domain-containing protein [Hydrogenophaga sp.]MDP1782994.1 PEP-CTERM sorting domain-containing protein [Hydrogenophaga sp.]MDP2075363.1 PEP-CTERM sorting domain-containing protein [Hydrogenophaga sp.]MDP3108286.1 PEP-CTERM sorting domain-containing protein [Hydrogenophaga sp.]MDP3347480.1 PEP-CTERM sorting domain-containing protein [Hydrogenophaga sp.]MDZ4398412.1 PEP-CTERM sorting domain-containing protein [Hydrogenophaga sp.]
MTLLKKTVAACAVALAGLAAVPAHAALTLGSIPGGSATNEFLSTNFGGGAIGPVEGWYGAQLYLSGGPAQITVDYFGAEAGFVNSFLGFGGCSFTHNTGGNTFTGSPVAPSCIVNNVASGLLNFSFTSPLGSAINGTNPDNVADNTPNFFVTLSNISSLAGLDNVINSSTPGGGLVAWLFFDDGGAGDDDNHDDMVVRLTITGGSVGIPEPGTIALLGAALLGMGAVRRRRANK